MHYVLITPARNEEAYIEKTVKSVLMQTKLPKKWVIVSNGSIDKTDEIVREYASQYDFIRLIKVDCSDERNFGAKALAFNAGYEALGTNEYEFIGNLDADITFEHEYYAKILREFEKNPKLGIAGGVISELIKNQYIDQNINLNSVAGAVQLFRRQCYIDIGGYIQLRTGGIDAAAEVMARMHGWNVRTFPEIKAFHHRRVGRVNKSFFKAGFQRGITRYKNGNHPLFEVIKCFYRILHKPYLVGSLLVLSGYFWSWIRGEEKILPKEVQNYLRSEQMNRLFPFMRLKKINKTAF